MKVFVLMVIICSKYPGLLAQTCLSFLGGVDFAKITDYDSTSSWENNVTVLEKGFSIESPCIGVRLKKILTKEIHISVTSDFTHKYFKATNFYGIAAFHAMSFNYFRNDVAINYKWNRFSVGLAACYNFINSIKHIYVNDWKYNLNTSAQESGIKLYGGYEYKKFELNLYYYRGFDSVQDAKDMLHWKPIQSIGLFFLYNLEM